MKQWEKMSKEATEALAGICLQTQRRILKFLRHESRPEDRPKSRIFHHEAMQRCGAIFAAGCSKVLITRCM
jgi:hypothetical protein